MSDFRIDKITNRDGSAGTQIAGISTFSGTSGMQLPSGPTEYRGGRGRGVFFGASSDDPDSMTLVEIATAANGTDFGNLANNLTNCKGCASTTRGLIMGGGTPSVVSLIQGVTISSGGGVFNFGDLSLARNDTQCVANDVRGIAAGGNTPATTTAKQNLIEFVTIASSGDTSEFGDLTVIRSMGGGSGSPTRGIIMGGGSSPVASQQNIIEYLTIATLGDELDFGDLSNAARTRTGNFSSPTRAVVAGGYTSTDVDHIDYVTIATKGNASDFGNMTSAREGCGCASSHVRGLIAGGTGAVNTIEYVTIATTGNATDFGDMDIARKNFGGFSDCHGGLG